MPSQLEQRCLELGIKLTGQRRTIAQVLSEADDRPDVEEVYRRASCLDHEISLAAVYRTLRLFEETGLVARHDAGDGRARYGGHGEPCRGQGPTPPTLPGGLRDGGVPPHARTSPCSPVSV